MLVQAFMELFLQTAMEVLMQGRQWPVPRGEEKSVANSSLRLASVSEWPEGLAHDTSREQAVGCGTSVPNTHKPVPHSGPCVFMGMPNHIPALARAEKSSLLPALSATETVGELILL